MRIFLFSGQKSYFSDIRNADEKRITIQKKSKNDIGKEETRDEKERS